MRFRSKISTIILSALLAATAFLPFSIPVSAAPYGSCSYGASTYEDGTCNADGTTTDLSDTGDNSLYIGIGAVILSIIAIVTIVSRKKPKHTPMDSSKTDL